MTFTTSAALILQQALSDDCRYGHACPETDKDGRGCCPAPKVEAKAAAEAKKAADAKGAAEAKKAANTKKAAEVKEAADARKATDTAKAATLTRAPATVSRCPSDMVRVPGGTFTMGNPAGVGIDGEHPQHQVTLSGYCIDKTEVTVAAYGRCVTSGKCMAALEPDKDGDDSLCNGTRADRQDHPVNCVDWNQAKAYCAWANKRLPSEAEWEYAARGGDGRGYPWGNEAPSAKRLNACGSECSPVSKRLRLEWKVMYEDSDGWEATAPVGSFPSGASPFGALDMAGNVSEWTADWHGAYTADALTNPHGPKEGKDRVIRGGNWSDGNTAWVRGASRFMSRPAIRVTLLGLRCARGD